GLLLGPSQVALAYVMRAHSGTLLLEGEGYILAAFFALLIPIYLFRSSAPLQKAAVADPRESESEPAASEEKASTAWSRFKQAVVLNLKANVLVAIVLVVAACYEAFEVISMAGR